jgi:RNA polymerase sigma-54 factor
MQNIVERPQSLQDHLAEQIPDFDLTAEDRALTLHIISFIDRTGYVGRRNEKDEFLPVSLLEIATSFDPMVTPERVERVLHDVVQHLDPPGVGARDLRECLLLQIDDETPQRDLVRKIILDHLEDVAHNRLPVIQKKTAADYDDITEALEVLKHFNPKPGNQYSSEGTRYVTPDVIIEKNDDGEYEIRLTDDWAPRLNIPKKYYLMYKNRDGDPQTREYLKKKLQSAEWLKDAIEQRRNTLERVTRAIVGKQKAFLDLGPDHIEPLKMQQIADQVGVHVTTVSRAVDDKWVMTPRGVFPLKRFFVGAAVNKETGEQIPWEKVKTALLEMVHHEDKSNPLSDEELEEKLQASGYPVKRRTVTKYRKLLSIPSSRERKAWVTT